MVFSLVDDDFGAIDPRRSLKFKIQNSKFKKRRILARKLIYGDSNFEFIILNSPKG
ncbi:hypothetical protein NIES4073_65920 [Kalymmatonema gypsitolerans NIES-4073]|nr:hypothetical protein NIES4073_65920 [Scytonema sp. NIES-4073]